MASNKVAGTLSTKIKMDTTEAQKNIKELNNDISSTVSILKQQEQELKNSGDATGALETKLTRLKETQNGYYEKLKLLKQAQNDVKDRLGESSTEYQKYQTQINNTITTISRYDSQINKAEKSLEYYNSGLADLKQSYNQQQRLSQSMIDRLKAEGNTYQANATEIKSLKSSLANLKQQYDIQERELDSIAEKSGKASTAYKTQATRLNETATSIANTQTKLKSMNTSFASSSETIAKARDKLSVFNKSTDDTSTKTTKLGSSIKNTALGMGIANTASVALSAVTNQVGDAVNRVDTLANSKRVFQNMGYSTKDTKTAMDNLNKSISGLPTSLDSAVSGVQLIASTTNDLKQAQKVWSALNDGIVGFGGSTEQVETAVQQLSQAFAGGKIDAETWNSMLDAQLGPTLNAIAKDMGMTSAQLKDGLSKGTISVKQFQDELIKLDTQGGGGLKSLSKIAHDSTSGISTAFTNMKTAVTRGLGNMITNFSNALGKVTGSNLSQIITKFGNNAEKVLSNLGTSIGKIVPIIKQWTPVFNAVKNVVKSAFSGLSPIIDAFKDALSGASKSGVSFKGVINTIATVLNALSPIIKVISDILGNTLAVAFKLVSSAINVVIKGIQGIINLNKSTTQFFKDAGDNAYKFAKSLKEDISDACDKAKKWMSDAWGNMKSTVSDAVTAMTDKNSKLHDEMISKISDATGVSKKTLNSAYDTMADSTQTWKDLVSGKWDKLGGDLKKVGNDISKTAKSAFQDMYDKLNEKTGGGLDKIKEKWSDMWDNLKKGAEKSAKNVGNGVVNIVNNVIKSINSMIKKVQKGVNWILDKFGASKVSFDTLGLVEKFATGGTVGKKGGTMALVNDAPGSNYREMFATPDGKLGMFPKERNFMTWLPEGTQVLNGEKSKALADMMGVPQFKDGTDNQNIFEKMFDKAWDIAKEVGNVIAHPIKFLENALGKYVSPDKSDTGWVKSVITKAPSYFAKQGMNWVKKLAESWKKKQESSSNGSGAVELKNGAELAEIIKKALESNGLPTTDAYVNAWLKQVATESSGNAKAVQPGADPDGDGSGPAKGLLQTKQSTFNAYKFDGHNDIFNAYDNALAAIRYAKLRYGADGMLQVVGHGHGYANGGFITQEQLAMVGEGNRPEVIIPLSSEKQGRALSLLTQTVNKMNRNAGNNTVVTTNNGSLEAKLDTMIGLLSQLITTNSNGFAKQGNGINTQGLYQQMYNDQTINNYQAF